MISLSIEVSHDFDEGSRDVESVGSLVDAAMSRATEEATTLVGNAVQSLVVSRTTMSQTAAERITEAKTEPSSAPNRSRGRVSFTDPPPGGWLIRPKNKKALFWQGARHPVKVVRHPGSRPYPLIGRAAQASTERVGKVYETRVGEVI